MNDFVIDCVFAIMIASLLGAFTLALMTFAWSQFEDTELWEMIKKHFGGEDK